MEKGSLLDFNEPFSMFCSLRKELFRQMSKCKSELFLRNQIVSIEEGWQMPSMEQELTFMEVRLFRLAQMRWKMDRTECADIFREHDLLGYIQDAYEEFHEQGDEANMEDIEAFLSAKGVSLDVAG